MTDSTPHELGTRDKILHAAMVMFGEDPGSRLSVRAVAARAGVSTGSLRHHFPTQRALQETVLTRVYDLVIPDDRIHDVAVPARERLVDCLRRVLGPAQTGQEARSAFMNMAESFIQPEPTADTRAAYLAIERESERRVEYWLTVLTKEGAVAEGDLGQQARFLLTVVNGLSLERVMPADDSLLARETATLQLAVDSVLATD